MTTAYLPQTTVDTMARIAAGVDPWIAFRDFLEDCAVRATAGTTVMSGIHPVSHLFEGGPHGGHAAGEAAQSERRPSGEAMTQSERAVTG